MWWSREWALHHSCIAFALWALAESCWRVQDITDVTAVNVLANFYSLIDENQRGLTGGANSDPNHINDFEFWRFSTIADVPGASAHQLMSFWWLRACSILNSFLSVNRIRSQFRGYDATNELSTSFQSFTLVVSRQKLNPLELVRLDYISSCLAIRRTDSLEIPDLQEIFRIDTVEFRWTCFLMSWRFLVALIVDWIFQFWIFCHFSDGHRCGRAPGTVWWLFWHLEARRQAFAQRRSCAFLPQVTPKFCLVD